MAALKPHHLKSSGADAAFSPPAAQHNAWPVGARL